MSRRRQRMTLEHTDAKVADEGARSLVLCMRVDSPLSEVSRAVGVEVGRLRAVVAGEALLGAGEAVRVDAWLGVVWARYAQRRGLCVDADEVADALATAARLGVEIGA